MRCILLAFGMLLSSAVLALDVAILSPLHPDSEVREARAAAATTWLQAWLESQDQSVQVLGLEELATAKPTRLVVQVLEHWEPAQWQSIAAYLAAGGEVIWNGSLAGKSPPTAADRAWLQRLAGIDLAGYVADPKIQQAPITQYMWLEATPPYALPKGSPAPLAVFAGEALSFAPVSGATAAMRWLQRDRTTSDGPAMLVFEPATGGRSTFIGTYLCFTAAGDDGEALPTQHARVLQGHLLGLGTAPQAAVEPLRPLNWEALDAPTASPRAMWLWDTNQALNSDSRAELLRFCELRSITVLYVYTGKRLEDDATRSAMATFVTEATAAGIQCHALDGWPEAVEPERQGDFLASVQRVLDYNHAVPPAARFTGFQSDVEPGTLPGYHSSDAAREALDRNYLDLHRRCAELIAASAQPMVFGCATAEARGNHDVTWQGTHQSLLQHLLGFTDYLAIMSYHDEAEEVLAASASIVAAAAAAGKQALVGFETLDVAARHGGSRAITFNEEGTAPMERAIAQVTAALHESVGFGSIAIHCYRAYRRLPRVVDWDYGTAALPPLRAAPFESWAALAADPISVRLGTAADVLHGAAAWTGPEDLAAEFRFAWSPDALYILAHVQDDPIITPSAGADIWRDDHIELWLAADLAAPSWQLGISADADAWLWYPRNLTADDRARRLAQLEATAEPSPGGYTIRCRIPVNALDLAPLAAGGTLRFICEVGDRDADDTPHETLLSAAPQRVRNRPASYRTLTLDPAP